MLHTISWTVFLLSCVCLAAAYYLFIGMAYYSKELKALAGGKLVVKKPGAGVARSLFTGLGHRNEPLNPAAAKETKTISPLSVVTAEPVPESLSLVSFRCEEELKQAIKTASIKRSAKEELIYAMRLIVNRDAYAQIANTPFKSALNNFIETECEEAGGAPFTADELNNLWKK